MVTKQEIQKTIDRLIGTKGNLNIPSWWMRKILSDLVKYCEDNELTSAIIKEYNKSQFNLVADKIEKLDAKLDNIGPHKLFEIVSELPVKPKDNIIYLVPSSKGEGNNVLTEWAWVNGSWEQFGEFGADVNLDDYATKEDLKSYATKDEVKPYDDSEIKQEISLRNVGAVDTNDSVEEPEIPSSEGNEEMLRILAGNTPNLVWEDIYGKIHYEIGELKSRKAQNDSTFRTTCRKLISCIPDTTSPEWAFLFGVQTEVGVIEEVYPYIFNSAKLTSLNFAFSGAPNIKDWGFLKHLDTSKITTMSGVFYKSEADIIDVSNWDVSNTTILGNNAAYSFFGNIKKVIGLENWDTSNAQQMMRLLSGVIEDYSGVKNWDVQNCSSFDSILFNISATDVDVSLWQIRDGADMDDFIRNGFSLVSFGMPNIPTGATTSNFGRHLTSLQNITMRTDALIYASLYFNESPLTAESVKTLLSHLAETPDEGATITFKNGLYAGYSAEDKVEIDTLRNTATTNGWTIVNMG